MCWVSWTGTLQISIFFRRECRRMPVYKDPDFRNPPPGIAAVFAAAGSRSFFSLLEWYDLLASCVVGAGSEIRIYTDERPGSMIAVPLKISKNGRRNSLSSLANFYSVEHEIIAAPEANLEIGLTAILAEINAERPRWSCLHFSELDPGATSYHVLVRRLRGAGLAVECMPGAATWYETTAGLDFERYLGARPSQLRNTWRRKRRRVMASHTLDFALFADESGVEQGVSDYERIYAASWKEREPFPEFMPALIRLAAQLGALRLGVYHLDGIPAAAQVWIVWQERAIIYKLAHDRRFDEFSLGTLLTMEMVERILTTDTPHEINLGRGDDLYKSLWLSKRRERWGITAANLRTVDGLWLGLERELAKIYHRLRGRPISAPAAATEPGTSARAETRAG